MYELISDKNLPKKHKILFTDKRILRRMVGESQYSCVWQIPGTTQVAKVICMTEDKEFFQERVPITGPLDLRLYDEIPQPYLRSDSGEFKVEGDQLRLWRPIIEREVLRYVHKNIPQGGRTLDNIVKLDATYFFIQDGEVYAMLVEENVGRDMYSATAYYSGIMNFPDKNERIFTVYQLASVLDVFQGIGVIHKDLKPRNLLQRKKVSNTLGRLTLIDFDISDLTEVALSKLDPNGQYPFLARERELSKGSNEIIQVTPLYSSPEQTMGKKLDCRSDHFSLGLNAVEILTGYWPVSMIEGNGVAQIQACIISEKEKVRAHAIEVLREKGFKESLVEAVSGLLYLDPSKRTPLSDVKVVTLDLLAKEGYDCNGMFVKKRLPKLRCLEKLYRSSARRTQ